MEAGVQCGALFFNSYIVVSRVVAVAMNAHFALAHSGGSFLLVFVDISRFDNS